MRTEVEIANEAVLLAADAWYAAYHARQQLSRDAFYEKVAALDGAIAKRAAAIARQDVEAKSVFLRTDASPEERLAAQHAMISRPGWRKCIYELLSLFPMSDRTLERLCEAHRGKSYHYRHPGSNRLDWVEIPDRNPSHQTISSARNSLCRSGLVHGAGVEKVRNQSHTLWTARPIG